MFGWDFVVDAWSRFWRWNLNFRTTQPSVPLWLWQCLATPLAEAEKEKQGKAAWGYLVIRTWGLVDITSSSIWLSFQRKNISQKVLKDNYGIAKTKKSARAASPLHPWQGESEKGIPGKLPVCFVDKIPPSYPYKNQVLLLSDEKYVACHLIYAISQGRWCFAINRKSSHSWAGYLS